ncbi:ABC transporter permease [Reichenbachiella sp. MALMAid0571]|uniref:ABC transporter permease n=1 Tax=Reichenbachiella sp. MALMAid0571 TaxID=3143939 RepID=UPI0032DF2B44
MGKIGLIIAREYLSRVRKKSFIIMTILGPLLFAGIAIVPTWLATRESTDQKVIWVLDESGYFDGKMENNGSVKFEMTHKSLEEAKAELINNKGVSLLYIPEIDINNKAEISFYSFNNPGFSLEKTIEGKIRTELENIKLINSGIEKEQLEQLKARVELSTYNLSKAGTENESSSEASSAVGYISAFLIYFFIFFYGAQIMRGVIEEKTSKVIEVIISSVKPFQLMMGKIIGVGAVGLTQFLLWTALSTGIVSVGSAILLKDVEPDKIESLAQNQPIKTPVKADTGNVIFDALKKVNFPLVIGCFVFYFLGGYLLYGALFAAVGSAVDSDADSQQFMLPITIPLIFSMVIIAAILKEPHGSLAVWTSIIPFTAPVVMMMRIPFDVPIWQIAASMLSVVGGFLATTWFAGRIYRIGIFMHGTKVNYKVLAKWFMMKI